MLRDYLIRKISNYIDLGSSKLLDVGCGTGRIVKLLGDKVSHYYGIDPNVERIEIAKKELPGLEFEIGYSEELPYEENKFNVIIFSMSWHMVKDFEQTLKEAKRVLKEDGILVILEPSDKTTNWVSPLLRKDSPEFKEDLYQKKLESIEKAKEFLKNQEIFKVVLEDFNEETKHNLWILKE